MTDIDKLIDDLNESCEMLISMKKKDVKYNGGKWTKSMLFTEEHGEHSEMIERICRESWDSWEYQENRLRKLCNSCSKKLLETQSKQLEKNIKYYEHYCDSCKKRLKNYYWRYKKYFTVDEAYCFCDDERDNKIYCDKCRTTFKILDMKNKSQRNTNIKETLSDIFDALLLISKKIDNIEEKL